MNINQLHSITFCPSSIDIHSTYQESRLRPVTCVERHWFFGDVTLDTSQNDPTWNQNRLSVLWVRTSTHFERPACHAARGKDMPLLLPQASGLNVDPTSDPLHGSNDSATQVVWEHDCPACPSLPQRCRPTHPSNYYKSITVWSYMIRTII